MTFVKLFSSREERFKILWRHHNVKPVLRKQGTWKRRKGSSREWISCWGVVDCAVSCIEVSGRCMEKHTSTQHTVCAVWLLMKKRLQEMKAHTSESRLATDYFFFFAYGLSADSLAEISRTCLVWSKYYQPRHSVGGNLVVNLLSEVCSLISWRHFLIRSHST